MGVTKNVMYGLKINDNNCGTYINGCSSIFKLLPFMGYHMIFPGARRYGNRFVRPFGYHKHPL